MQIGFLQIWIFLNSKIVIGTGNEKGKNTFFDTYFSPYLRLILLGSR